MTTYETLAYLKKRRDKCNAGDFVVQESKLFYIFGVEKSETKEMHVLCWRVIRGQRSYKASFSSANLVSLPPLSGIFLNRELGENVSDLLAKVDWLKITQEIVSYAQGFPVSNDLVIPLATSRNLLRG